MDKRESGRGGRGNSMTQGRVSGRGGGAEELSRGRERGGDNMKRNQRGRKVEEEKA